MKYYRDTLFIRSLSRLVAEGRYRVAYLINAAGLILAAAPPSARERAEFGALAASAATLIAQANAAGFSNANQLTVHQEGGSVIVFYSFRHIGETDDVYIIAAEAEGPDYDVTLIPAVAATIGEDLKIFY